MLSASSLLLCTIFGASAKRNLTIYWHYLSAISVVGTFSLFILELSPDKSKNETMRFLFRRSSP
jgi:hypothetical protein